MTSFINISSIVGSNRTQPIGLRNTISVLVLPTFGEHGEHHYPYHYSCTMSLSIKVTSIDDSNRTRLVGGMPLVLLLAGKRGQCSPPSLDESASATYISVSESSTIEFPSNNLLCFDERLL